MNASLLRSFADRIEGDLRENVLPFWLRHGVDRQRGTIVGALTNDLRADASVERGALLTCRVLWTFAAAYRRYSEPAYLEMADLAYRDLFKHFADQQHGGFFWSVDASGNVLSDRKQVYGQAFAIYALTEYHLASGRASPLDEAIALYRLLELAATDRSHGGYWEAFSRDWQPIADMRLSLVDQNDPKSQNTHLHVMEAYSNLLRAWPDEGLRFAQHALVTLMLDRIVEASTAHLGLFFTADWVPTSQKISYGHDIEAAWLLTEAAERLTDPALLARARTVAVRIANVTLAEGMDADGAVYNEGSPAGLTNTDKEWWPQAEAMVGFLNAYQIGGEERHLAAALGVWEFIERSLIDRRHGEWFRGVRRDGTLLSDQLKISFWKCPYHNGRAGLEASARLRKIASHL